MRRIPMDWDALRREQSGKCFICEFQAGTPGFEHEKLHEDADSIAFLSKYPSVYGHTLVAPKQHREAVTADFQLDEYVHLQQVVFRVAEALRIEVPTERIYILSLGSQQGNRHVHWHVAPLPPGVPYPEQQFRALDRSDILDLSTQELRAIADRLRTRLSG